jgi:hypothetical protein
MLVAKVVTMNTPMNTPPRDPEPVHAGRRPLARRPIFWGLLGFVGLLVVLGMLFTAAVPMSSEVLRHRIVQSLSEKLDADVELGDLTLRVFPGLRAEGKDLRIRKRGVSTDLPPMISVKSFHVDANLVGLMAKHADHVRLDGLDVNILPGKDKGLGDHNDKDNANDKDHGKEEKDHGKEEDDRAKGVGLKAENARSSTPKTQGTSGTAAEGHHTEHPEDTVIIDRIDAVDARVIIVPREDKKQPKIWAIHQLQMQRVGIEQEMPFEATLTNGVPPGEIEVQGKLGPWQRDNEGDTPLGGSFNFAKADLSVFKGISGTLSSQGYFGGTLDQLAVNGETDTPDFTIKVGGHPFPLHVKYQSLVDGTNGDTRLNQIDAWFLNSYLHATGAVLDGPKGQHGRTVSLDVQMDKSRIEDIMKMAVKTPTPPMTGALKLTTKFLLPPGESDVSERLRLDGRFAIGRAQFTNFDVQGKIEELSKRGRGQTAQVANEHVVSDFQGRFKLADGRLDLPDLTFAVPGAKVRLAGGYALKPETLDFQGQLLLDGKVSEAMTGWKRMVAKFADPIFAQKDGSGSVLPIKVSGSRSDPKFGLDVRRVFRKGS